MVGGCAGRRLLLDRSGLERHKRVASLDSSGSSGIRHHLAKVTLRQAAVVSAASTSSERRLPVDGDSTRLRVHIRTKEKEGGGHEGCRVGGYGAVERRNKPRRRNGPPCWTGRSLCKSARLHQPVGLIGIRTVRSSG